MKIVFTSLSKEDAMFYRKELGTRNVMFLESNIKDVKPESLMDADILCVFVLDKLDETLLSRLKNLKLIHTRSVGYDHIDVDFCKKKGIKVTHVPEYSPSAIAQHTLALILSLLRFIPKIRNRVSHMEFSASREVMSRNLEDLTVGVIGTGRIGGLVARYMVGLGSRVFAYDLIEREDLVNLGVEFVTLEELLTESDVVTLHVPYTPKTHHLINGERISLMKDGVIFINTSRGAVVDTDALYTAYTEGKLGGIGLDVFEDEELLILKDYRKGICSAKVMKILELVHKENVIVTPHIAFYTSRAVNNIRDATLKVIRAFIEGNEKTLKDFLVTS